MPETKTIQIDPNILPDRLALNIRIEQAKASLPQYLYKKIYKTFIKESPIFSNLTLEERDEKIKRTKDCLNGRTMREDIVEAFEAWADSHKNGEAA